MFQFQFNTQRDKMFYPCMSRLPGWAVYYLGYINFDVEDPKQQDVEANDELQRLLSQEKKIPKTR